MHLFIIVFFCIFYFLFITLVPQTFYSLFGVLLMVGAQYKHFTHSVKERRKKKIESVIMIIAGGGGGLPVVITLS